MVVFYEKTGCKTNTRQKKLLQEAGFEVEARDLREENWEPSILRSFFEGVPVVEWFNKAAPQVKSGEVDPSKVSEYEAIVLMVENPLLIRRPLLKTKNGVGCGFESDTLKRLGLDGVDPIIGKEGCSNDHDHKCPDPKGL